MRSVVLADQGLGWKQLNPGPTVEGHPVEGTVVKMSGAAPLDDLDGRVIGVDDVVQMISQFRCVGIHHKVDEGTGNLIRVQVLRPIEMALAPIEPSDLDDTASSAHFRAR